MLLSINADNVDALAATMVEHGAEVVIPIDDQFHGERAGRLRDPFGHLWVLSQPSEELTHEQIQQRVADQAG